MPDGSGPWRPHPGPQTQALASPSLELLFGGGAGGGKSVILFAGACRYIDNSNFRGIFFRNTYGEALKVSDQEARPLYEPLGGKFVDMEWRFPSGAKVYLSYLARDANVYDHQGAAYQYIAFDELTHFTAFQYRYLFSRLRSKHGIVGEIRASCNPEPGWVKDRFAPWVDKTYTERTGEPAAASGEIRHVATDDKGVESIVPRGTPDALSRSFIRSRLIDNPSLSGTPYAANLKSLDPVQRARLLDGDWDAVYAPGIMFKRGWFELVPAAPGQAWRVRYWDRAATDPEKSKDPSDPDWTVGCLMAWEGPLSGKPFYVEDVVRFRGDPAEVWATIVQTSKLDRQKYGDTYIIGLEQEPGGGGKFEVHSYMAGLRGYNVQAFPPVGNKVARASPMSASASIGVMKLVNGIWVKPYLDELEAFPQKKVHDDQVDASSGAFSVLTSLPLHYWQSLGGGPSAAQARFGHLPAI
jgi:predicted phage terminase large subunit-like protein